MDEGATSTPRQRRQNPQQQPAEWNQPQVWVKRQQSNPCTPAGQQMQVIAGQGISGTVFVPAFPPQACIPNSVYFPTPEYVPMYSNWNQEVEMNEAMANDPLQLNADIANSQPSTSAEQVAPPLVTTGPPVVPVVSQVTAQPSAHISVGYSTTLALPGMKLLKKKDANEETAPQKKSNLPPN